ncbi:MAG: beta-N-acetylhexosaminidase [Clostridia bacterium]|nr:beta-N-acetylhexosaminidase [Clostridia bacterium]
MKRFGVMLDMSRNAVMKVDSLKKFIQTLKTFGYNMIQLYTEDTYEVENEPYFGYMRGRYTVEELKDVVSYCNDLGMEAIPCIQTLAHLNQIFRWAEYSEVRDVNDILLVEEDRTYQLIENMFKTLRKTFTSEYVHIGMDEAHMLGLGKYLDKHGVKNRFDILYRHLMKVIGIAEKYGFKPIMWSDMFFRLANRGEYYPPDPQLSDEVRAKIPQQVGLVYWDYYNNEQSYFEKMMKAHQTAGETWFAGGAWTWAGFAPGNKKTMDTMTPAMRAAKNTGIENIFITMWGDNGKECSFWAMLPSLFAIRKLYDGETDMQAIKQEFQSITGEDYDAFTALELPNLVGECYGTPQNPSKHMLYSDPFNGFLDSTVKKGVGKEYEQCAARLTAYAEKSQYAYLFKSMSALCSVMAVKYDLGARTRIAYQAKDRSALQALIADYQETETRLEKFYQAFQTLWFTENKPHGFDVQDLRLGGLMQRLKSCRLRLVAFLGGKVEDIPELEEKLLDFYCRKDGFDKTTPVYNWWVDNASVNII